MTSILIIIFTIKATFQKQTDDSFDMRLMAISGILGLGKLGLSINATGLQRYSDSPSSLDSGATDQSLGFGIPHAG